jgi:hypothetical protein
MSGLPWASRNGPAPRATSALANVSSRNHYRSQLMPAAVADVGVLRRNDVPTAVDLAQHASADALAVLLAQCIVHHLALDPEPRVQDCDVGRDECHLDLGRAPRARPVRAVRAVQALHQVAESLTARGPGAVDGDELCVVDKRRGDGIGIRPSLSLTQAVDFNIRERNLRERNLKYTRKPLGLINVGMHCLFGGRPLMAGSIESVLVSLTQTQGIWNATHGEIASWFEEQGTASLDKASRFPMRRS